MNVALCCIGRLENRYALEFVKYYNNLGIDHIYIYDNNYDGEENFEDVLQSYIDSKFVSIINCRNKLSYQTIAYESCYYHYGNKYDYILFFDFDEYLVLKNNLSIKEYLSQNNGFDVICINWKIYDDNDLIYDDGRDCCIRFNHPSKFIDANDVFKSIVKTKINNIKWATPHMPYVNNISKLKYCNNNFEKINFNNIDDIAVCYNESNAYLKHFLTKTASEFKHIKLLRGGGFMDINTYRSINLEQFFKINNYNEQKNKILNIL